MLRMGDAAEARPVVADALRLQICPACDYALAGLPPEGTCPECGGQYDQSLIVLDGWARGDHVHVGNARPWIAVLLLLPNAWYLWVTWQEFRQSQNPWLLLMPGVVVALIAWLLWVRFTSDRRGPTRVWLGLGGCVQADDDSVAKTRGRTPWSQIESVELIPRGGDRLHVKLGRSHRWYRLSSTAVNAEVHWPAAHVDALRARIDEWRSASPWGIPATERQPSR